MSKLLPPELLDTNWVETAYVTIGLTTHAIARNLGCSQGSVSNALRRHNIEAREPGRERGPKELQDRAWLEEQYRQLTTHEIARLLRCGQVTVLKAMKRLGIQLNGHGKRLRIAKYKQQLGPDKKNGPQHRLIMEAHLGRELTAEEHVHHIDGNPRNNTLENLIVMMKSQHHRLHGQNAKMRMANFDYSRFRHTCSKCGQVFRGGSAAKRCPPCRTKTHQYFDHVCTKCGIHFTGGNVAKRCPSCRSKRTGEGRSPHTRLTDPLVREIRQRVEQGEPQVSVARSLGLSKSHVGLVIHGKIWKHVI